jgi:hypothetical protein
MTGILPLLPSRDLQSLLNMPMYEELEKSDLNFRDKNQPLAEANEKLKHAQVPI